MPGVLITANVFQNGLAKREASQYLEQLTMLSALPLESYPLYMSALDYNLAFSIPEYYSLGQTQRYVEVCQQMQERLSIIHIDEIVREQAQTFPNLNYFDAVRLSCALDPCSNVGMIVTWEPYQFVRNQEEMFDIRRQQFFDYQYPTECLDSGDYFERNVRVYSVEGFIRHEVTRDRLMAGEGVPHYFCLGDLEVHSLNQINADLPESTVTVTIVHSTEAEICTGQQRITSSTPVKTLYQAIDACIEQFVSLPPRSLNYYWVPGKLGGPESEAEVVIRVECDGNPYEATASNPSIIRAFGDAYVQAINQILNARSSS
ncbi:MAG: hypothetical protein Fur0046_32240 [Cyanobacteria bacterium J069]|nr:MAG: hypothetical protein D6742_02270 [Cyanobacteria bacterium J069]